MVGARYWNGAYTDVPAIGFDEYVANEGYCKDGDQINFKVWDASLNSLITVEAESEIFWNNLGMSVINLTELPQEYSLSSAFPNPFNPSTTLNFSLPLESDVQIIVYDLQGREVVSLADGKMDVGFHTVVWNADRYSSGVYFVKMVAGEYISNQKLMLVK